MSRKTTWKFFYITDHFQMRQLQGAISGSSEFAKSTTYMSRNGFETNMPWSSLRSWFRFAGVPLPDIGSSEKSSWELAIEDGEEVEIPHGIINDL